MKPTEDRSWQHAVLSADKERTRYIARQLIWRLTVEDYPALILGHGIPRDFDLLVDSLGRPKYPKPDGGDSETRTSSKKKAKPLNPKSFPRLAHHKILDVVVGVTTGLPTPLRYSGSGGSDFSDFGTPTGARRTRLFRPTFGDQGLTTNHALPTTSSRHVIPSRLMP